MKLFISYSRDDKAWVYELWRNLRDEAHHDAWIDQRLVAASNWWFSICENIEKCECFIYVLTPKSADSIYCEGELDYALALNKPVLPVRIKDCNIPAKISSVQVLTLADNMSLDGILFRIEQGLRRIQEERSTGAYATPATLPTRPGTPSPSSAKPEHVFEVFVLAAEAFADNQFTTAETLFNQVIKADPDGLGAAAKERLEEIKYAHARDQLYQSVVRLALNSLTQRDAKMLWQQYTGKYGRDHDPQTLAAKLGDTLPAVTLTPIAPPSTSTPASSVQEIEPTEDEIEPGESSYARLTVYLQSRPMKENRMKMSFEEIEQIMRRELPPSAYKHRPWWSNRMDRQSHERAWLDAGWRVGDISVTERTVNFVRTDDRGQQYIAFFSMLMKELEEKSDIPFRMMSPSAVNWHAIGGGFRDKSNLLIGILAFTFTRKQTFSAEFYIDCENKERNKAIFDALKPNIVDELFRVELGKLNPESDLVNLMTTPGRLYFERLDNRRASRIAAYLNGTITDSEESLAHLRRAAVTMMIALYHTIQQSLELTGEKYTFS